MRASHYQEISPFPRMKLDEGLNGQEPRASNDSDTRY